MWLDIRSQKEGNVVALNGDYLVLVERSRKNPLALEMISRGASISLRLVLIYKGDDHRNDAYNHILEAVRGNVPYALLTPEKLEVG